MDLSAVNLPKEMRVGEKGREDGYVRIDYDCDYGIVCRYSENKEKLWSRQKVSL
jgi:hypothetical protein